MSDIVDHAVHYAQTQTLDLRVGHVEKCIGEMKCSMSDMKDSVHSIELQIAKQNGTLPRIEASVGEIERRLREDEKAGAVSLTENRTRDRVTWTLIGGIFMTLVGVVLKFFILN